MPTTSAVRTVELPARPTQVWRVLADFASIGRWAPNVDHSCALTQLPSGVGAVRRIQTGRATVIERVLEWEPPSRLSYSIEGLPPVVRRATNSWSIEPAGQGSLVSLTSRVDVGRRPPHRIVARAVATMLGRASDRMLAGLADELTTTDGAIP